MKEELTMKKSYKVFENNEIKEQEAIILSAQTPEEALEQALPFLVEFQNIVVEELPEFDSKIVFSFNCKKESEISVSPEFYCRSDISVEGLVMCASAFIEIFANHLQISVKELLDLLQEITNE